MLQKLAILVILYLCLSVPGQPAMAAGLLSGPDRNFNLAMFALGSLGFSLVAHYMYKNSPAERIKGYPEELELGEWYVAGYTGVSYLPSADWAMSKNFGGTYGGRTAQNIVYQPGILGGIKFGRYFDSLPWFGVEVETNFSRNNLRGNQGRISPPVPGGAANALGGPDWFMIWDLQCNLLARYGFLKDKEVPFGRLQPYVGIGPGFEVIYAKSDSAKNFSLETQAGVRYMCTQNVALFVEYKFSYQFDVEYQNFLIAGQSGIGTPGGGTMTFDVPHHRFVVGVSYHFKNLYGN
ncbi:MAG: outer membrane beta-barrel protein [Syntrophales bacterium]|nr:outer membrane beta-barrel protein [Syntrophales bacterium]